MVPTGALALVSLKMLRTLASNSAPLKRQTLRGPGAPLVHASAAGSALGGAITPLPALPPSEPPPPAPPVALLPLPEPPVAVEPVPPLFVPPAPPFAALEPEP